jgi:hypothetical protein
MPAGTPLVRRKRALRARHAGRVLAVLGRCRLVAPVQAGRHGQEMPQRDLFEPRIRVPVGTVGAKCDEFPIHAVQIPLLQGDPDQCGSQTLGPRHQLVKILPPRALEITLVDEVPPVYDQQTADVRQLTFDVLREIRQ